MKISKKVKVINSIPRWKYIVEEKVTYVDIWWVKFLKWLFEDDWNNFKDGVTNEATMVATKRIDDQMESYKRQLDKEILSLVDIAKPGLVAKEWHEWDIPELAPEPNIVNGIAYPKRLVLSPERKQTEVGK